MAYVPHFRFTVRGDFTGTPEHFSFGFHMQSQVESFPDADLVDIDESAVTAAVTAFWQSGSPAIGTNAKLTDWRAYKIGTDGRMVGNPLLHDMSAANVAGGQTVRYPPQIALVMTTVGANRGPGRFGRFYLPTAVQLDADMRISVSSATAAADSATAFLKAVSDAIDLPDTTLSAAGLNVSGIGAGTNQQIDHLECGRALDTLRNRRKSLLEDRHVHGHIDW